MRDGSCLTLALCFRTDKFWAPQGLCLASHCIVLTSTFSIKTHEWLAGGKWWMWNAQKEGTLVKGGKGRSQWNYRHVQAQAKSECELKPAGPPYSPAERFWNSALPKYSAACFSLLPLLTVHRPHSQQTPVDSTLGSHGTLLNFSASKSENHPPRTL